MAFMAWAKPQASMSYTVRPVSLLGRPALGFTIKGRDETLLKCFMNGSSWTGPRPQFRPMTSAPSPSRRAAAVSTVPPVSIFPFSSRVTVANTGRDETSLAASTAAFNS